MSALTQMNLGDPELEVLDPTPNVHCLFIHFDKTFFWTKLASRAVVRWSKRMYSCAGICSYEGRNGLCDIALSEPLLKLRPRKDLVETLLHEMIHAFLFVTRQDQDRDGHGPIFQAHMYRINKCAGLNISIYHDFHDEVKLYQTHWWRCSGPCQQWRPYFGVVRKSMNKAPGPTDSWWECHKRKCGGNFVKIKEPEKTTKKAAPKAKRNNGDITKYIDKNVTRKPVLKDSNSNIIKGNTGIKSNSSSTLVITKKGENNKPVVKATSPILFSGKGVTLDNRKRSNSVDVVETVRNVWANRTLDSSIIKPKGKDLVKRVSTDKITKPTKHKVESNNSPPAKIKKIDDYFKSAATLLKDVYGVDFNVTQAENKKIIATAAPKTDLVDCPICNAKIDSKDINRHIDECLNKDVIECLAKSNDVNKTNVDTQKNSIHKDVKPLNPNNDDLTLKIKTEKPIKTEPVTKEQTNTMDLTHIDFKSIHVKTEIKQEPTRSISKFNTIDLTDIDSLFDIKTGIKQESNTNRNIDKLVEVDINKEIEPGPSRETRPNIIETEHNKIGTEPKTEVDKCAVCGEVVDKPIEQHLDECLAFFNNSTEPEEGASTSFVDTIVIDDDDDVFDESLTLNATGTKTPCPCCMEMIEVAEMNEHLDNCLA